MNRVIRHCGECGWRDTDRDKHADLLDHYCSHPSLRPKWAPSRTLTEERAARRHLHIVTGETEDLNESGWPEIPSFCALVEQEPVPRLPARAIRPKKHISVDGYVMHNGEPHRVNIPNTAAPGEMFEITMPDGEVVLGVYMGEE